MTVTAPTDPSIGTFDEKGELGVIFMGDFDQDCSHLEMIQDVTPSSPDQCLQCVEMGDVWVNLRLCMICGQVGCCDNSKNTHATKHFHSDGHGIIKSHQPGEDWYWCYLDEVLFTLE